MAVRFYMDAYGIRASRPGSDALSGSAGLVLDINRKAGRILAHSSIAMAYKTAAELGAPAGPGSNFIQRCQGTIYYPKRSARPEVICFPHRGGLVRVPHADNGANRYNYSTDVFDDHTDVYFYNNSSAANDAVDSGLPSHVIYFLYNKPALST